MRIRDIIIVGVGLLFCIIAWSQDGAIQFQRSFQIAIPDAHFHHILMPRPIVLDPAGLGRPVLLATVRRGELTCYATHHFRHGMKHDYVPLHPSSRLPVEGSIIAMGAGYIESFSTRARVFLVTAEYQLYCIDVQAKEALHLVWVRDVIPERAEHPAAERAAVSVVPERVYDTDVGLVTVWIRTVDEHNIPVHIRAAFHALDGSLRWRHVSYAQGDAGDVVHEAVKEHVLMQEDGASDKDGINDDNNTDGNRVIGATDSPQRSAEKDALPADDALHAHRNRDMNLLDRYREGHAAFQWAERPGVKERWTHVMSAERAMHSRMVEQPWTSYREAVMSALPHRYAHQWDSRLSPHAFYPAKSRRQAAGGGGAGVRDAGARLALRYKDCSLRIKPQDDYGELGEKLALWETRRRRLCAQDEGAEEQPGGNDVHGGTKTPASVGGGTRYPPLRRSRSIQVRRAPVNALVYHGKSGMEVWHLYTGHIITRVTPLKAYDTYYHDINNDNYIESISTRADRGGAETDGMARGTTAADADEDDGVGADGPEGQTHFTPQSCWGVVQTGIPVAEHDVYRANICEIQGLFRALNGIRDLVRAGGRRTDPTVMKPDGGVADGAAPLRERKRDSQGETDGDAAAATTTTTTDIDVDEDATYAHARPYTPERILPTVVQIHTYKARYLVQVDRYAVFMLPSGLVTCVDPSRHRVLWRTSVPYGATATASVPSAYTHEDRMAAGVRYRQDMRATVPRRGTGIKGSKDARGHEGDVLPYPHLMPYSFTQLLPESDIEYVGRAKTAYERNDPYLLVFREGAMTVLDSRRGGVVSFAALLEIPVAPVSVLDYNGDGVNDVVVVSRHFIYGLVGTPQASSSSLAILMMLMLALLLLLFISREAAVRRGGNSEAELSLPSVAPHRRAASHVPFKRATD